MRITKKSTDIADAVSSDDSMSQFVGAEMKDLQQLEVSLQTTERARKYLSGTKNQIHPRKVERSNHTDIKCQIANVTSANISRCKDQQERKVEHIGKRKEL